MQIEIITKFMKKFAECKKYVEINKIKNIKYFFLKKYVIAKIPMHKDIPCLKLICVIRKNAEESVINKIILRLILYSNKF